MWSVCGVYVTVYRRVFCCGRVAEISSVLAPSSKEVSVSCFRVCARATSLEVTEIGAATCPAGIWNPLLLLVKSRHHPGFASTFYC
jgi:hypothetical protein